MGGGRAGGCVPCGAVGLGAAVAGGGEASLATFRPGGGVVGSRPPDRPEWADAACPAEPPSAAGSAERPFARAGAKGPGRIPKLTLAPMVVNKPERVRRPLLRMLGVVREALSVNTPSRLARS